jgi:hypothetical protein
MYRVKVGSKEYILYFVTEYARDYLGNKHDWTHIVGKYNHPVFETKFDMKTGRPTAAGILDTEQRYEIPFTGPDSVDAILREGTIPYDTKFYIDAGLGIVFLQKRMSHLMSAYQQASLTSL